LLGWERINKNGYGSSTLIRLIILTQVDFEERVMATAFLISRILDEGIFYY
jgi:hypothetical protein